VRLPYACIDVTRSAHLSSISGTESSLSIPVFPGRLDEIQLIRNADSPAQEVRGRGLSARALHIPLRGSGVDQVELSGSYRVPLRELGGLLFRAASEIEARGRVSGSRPTALRHADEAGFFAIPLSQLSDLPACCCQCLTPTESKSTFTGSVPWISLLTLGQVSLDVSVDVPECPSCSAASIGRWKKRLAAFMSLGFAIGFALGMAIGSLDDKQGAELGFMIGIGVVTALVTALLGGVVAGRMSRVVDVRRPLGKGDIKLRFRNAEYARRVSFGSS
jgi:hypothetical protein